MSKTTPFPVKPDNNTTKPDGNVNIKSPQTGDNSRFWLRVALALVSGGCLLGTAVYGKRRKVNR